MSLNTTNTANTTPSSPSSPSQSSSRSRSSSSSSLHPTPSINPKTPPPRPNSPFQDIDLNSPALPLLPTRTPTIVITNHYHQQCQHQHQQRHIDTPHPSAFISLPRSKAHQLRTLQTCDVHSLNPPVTNDERVEVTTKAVDGEEEDRDEDGENARPECLIRAVKGGGYVVEELGGGLKALVSEEQYHRDIKEFVEGMFVGEVGECVGGEDEGENDGKE